MQLGSMFIINCNNALHVSEVFCVHPQEHLEIVVAASVYDMHVIHQRLLLQFLSAAEDGRKKLPKHVQHYCS